MQHTKRMRRIVLSSVVSVVLKYFSTLSHKRYAFCKKLLDIKCVSILSTNFVQNISDYKKNSDLYYHKHA